MPSPSFAKIWVIATTELRTLVRSTAFVVSLLLLPVMLVGSLVVQRIASNAAVRKERNVAVVDGTGKLGGVLVREGAAVPSEADAITDRARYRVEVHPGDTDRLALAKRVRAGDLVAYVEIPAEILSDPKASVGVAAERTDIELVAWVERTLSVEARRQRLAALGVRAEDLAKADERITVERRELHEERAGVVVAGAAKRESLLGFLVPFALALLLFSSVMMVAPQLMTAVVEEKMSRISEVLLGCASPFEIMMGKMCAGTMVAMLSGTLYLFGLARVASAMGVTVANPITLVLAFYVFQILTVMTFGSLFLGVGSACSELKDAQTLMTPIVLVATTPLLTMTALLRDPHGDLATVLSLVPPTAPIVLMFRVATPPGPPLVHVVVGATATAVAAVASVWAAGRIFRVGLLRAGQVPKVSELFRWVFGRE